jgi:hypothetical protein
MTIPSTARRAWLRDLRGLPDHDPGIRQSIDEAIRWLVRAQEMSISQDGGVARDFSLVKGWASSYPETTGYIVPTMLEYAEANDNKDVRASARRMLDWLVTIQFEEGGFQGGRIDSAPAVPVTFNTGQILVGLAAGVRSFGDAYLSPMQKAADWLVATQDDDGCWRKHPTPFAAPGEKAYETHVAWGLFEADRVKPASGYAAAGLKNVDWALQWQRDNGWFDKCCLSDPTRPLTHTLGYVLRGILEAYRISGDDRYLDASRRTADGILSALRADGYLPGRLYPNWRGAVSWVCLTGTVQIAHCWIALAQITGDDKYRNAGFAANKFVRRSVSVDGPAETRGAVRGSFPVSGDYGHLEFLNWSAKFFVDSMVLERKMRQSTETTDA